MQICLHVDEDISKTINSTVALMFLDVWVFKVPFFLSDYRMQQENRWVFYFYTKTFTGR